MDHDKFNIESITLKQYLQNKLNFNNEQCKSIINDLYEIQNKKICLQVLEFTKFEEIVNYLTNLYLKQYSK